MATAMAYVIPTSLCSIPGSATTFTVDFTAVVGDGVAQSITFVGSYTYDATQSVAANLAALKTQVVIDSAGLFTLLTSDILVFTAVN